MGDRDGDDDTKLFVGNITYNTTKRNLEDVFEKFGKVLEVRIAEEPGGSGRSRGYAFVTMEDPKDAVDAVREGTGVIVDGREIKVEVATGVRGSGSRGGRSGACYDFQRGQCSRGNSCKFSHDGDDRGGGGGGRDRDSRDDRNGRDRDSRRDDRGRDSGRSYDRDDRGRDSDRRDDRRGGSDSHRDSRDSGRDRGSDRGRERSRDRDSDRGGRDRSRDKDRDSDRRDSRRERDRSRDDDRGSRSDRDRR